MFITLANGKVIDVEENYDELVKMYNNPTNDLIEVFGTYLGTDEPKTFNIKREFIMMLEEDLLDDEDWDDEDL